MGFLSNFFGSSESRQNPSTVWEGQVPFLNELYGQSQALAQQQAGQIGPEAQFYRDALFGGLGAFGSPTSNPAYQNLLQRSQADNPYLDQQIQGLGRDASYFLSQVGMPGLKNAYGATGGTSNPRMQQQYGQMTHDTFRSYMDAATNLRSNAYAQGGQAAGTLGALSNNYLGQMGNLFNLGMAPYQSAWMPWQNFGNLVGSPTVLGGGATGQGPGLGYSALNSFLGGL